MALTAAVVLVLMAVLTVTNMAGSTPVSVYTNVQHMEDAADHRTPRAGRELQCTVLEHPGPCANTPSWRHGVTLPNLYGHHGVDQALTELRAVLETLPAPARADSGAVGGDDDDLVTQFLCTLYLPPCPRGAERGSRVGLGSQGGEGAPPLPLPCRPLCEMARAKVVSQAGQGGAGGQSSWPSDIRCHMFPTEKCFALSGPGEVKYVTNALVASGTSVRMHDVIPQSVAPLESELGDDDPFDVQVVTMGTNHIPPRRYDLSDLGDPALFQGWADVQGTGAANDYCRVIGKGKRRFLSCALAGTRGQDHQYVSKLGFEPGHPGTWFMRDVDSDGRDDYCRCVGANASSRVVCMKAGEKGFYGSTVQGGSESTFHLPTSSNCHRKHFNPHFGL